MEAREDEAADPVADEQWLLARRETHLRLGRSADALHAAAATGDDLLDRRRRVHGNGHDPWRLTDRQADERRKVVHVVHDAAAVVRLTGRQAPGVVAVPVYAPSSIEEIVAGRGGREQRVR